MEQEPQIPGQLEVEEVIALSEAEDGPRRDSPHKKSQRWDSQPMTRAERARRVVADRLKGEQDR